MLVYVTVIILNTSQEFTLALGTGITLFIQFFEKVRFNRLVDPCVVIGSLRCWWYGLSCVSQNFIDWGSTPNVMKSWDENLGR